MEPQGSFGPRLRQERERRQISLASIAANTKISKSLLDGLERDDVSRWPSGIFRRSFVRAYAQAIGLNPEDIVREFAERFPDPAEPPPADAAAAAPSAAVEAPRAARSAHARTAAPAPARQSDRVEFVFRVNVPRSWVSWLSWLSSRVGLVGRQNT